MRSWIPALALASIASLWAPAALPCGIGFGQGLTLKPSQQIMVAYKNGVETYAFSPSFCGSAATFGLILPVPAPLTSNPQLAPPDLFLDLEMVTSPSYIHVDTCKTDAVGSGKGFGSDAGNPHEAGSVAEVSKGLVGDFEWSLLKADSVAAFTDWLDANHFPHANSSTAPYQSYVDAGWYFVAFKVNADVKDPPTGYKLCGSLGPIMLSFPAPKPVVPARIVAASTPNTAMNWRLFVVGDRQYATNPSGFPLTLRYSGAFTTDDLAPAHEGLNALASGGVIAAGDWLTAGDTIFTVNANEFANDIEFSPAPNQQPYRQQIVIENPIDCNDPAPGCTIPRQTSTSAAAAFALGLGALALLWNRKRRR